MSITDRVGTSRALCHARHVSASRQEGCAHLAFHKTRVAVGAAADRRGQTAAHTARVCVCHTVRLACWVAAVACREGARVSAHAPVVARASRWPRLAQGPRNRLDSPRPEAEAGGGAACVRTERKPETKVEHAEWR